MSSNEIAMTDDGVKEFTGRFTDFITHLLAEQTEVDDHPTLLAGTNPQSPSKDQFKVVDTLSSHYGDYFTSVDAALGQLYTDLDHIRTALLNAQLTLNNAEDETLTEAQMMSILQGAGILGGTSSTTANPPSITTP